MRRVKQLTRLDWLEIIALCIKAATGVVGGSMVLEKESYNSWLILGVLSTGAIADVIVTSLYKKGLVKQYSKDEE